MSLATYMLIFLLAFAFELSYTAYTHAVSRRKKVMAICATAVLPWFGFFEMLCLIDATTLGERLLIGTLTSLGFAAGCAIVLHLSE